MEDAQYNEKNQSDTRSYSDLISSVITKSVGKMYLSESSAFLDDIPEKQKSRILISKEIDTKTVESN